MDRPLRRPTGAPKSLAAFCRTVLPILHRAADGKRILADVHRILRTDRWISFDKFRETTKTLAGAYAAAGAKTEVYRAPTAGPVGIGKWVIPEAADVRTVTADILAPVRKRIIDYRRNPWGAALWSTSTPPGGVTGVLAVVDTMEALRKIKPGRLAGRIVLTRMPLAQQIRNWYEHRILAIISDTPVGGAPEATNWAKFGWGGVALETGNARLVGLSLSSVEGDRLRALHQKHGTVTLHINVDIHRYQGTHDVVSGIVPGRNDPQDELWTIAHSAEPGAADNTSGVAVSLEMARILLMLSRTGKIPPPRRSLRFLHGIECYGFFHYLEHVERLQTPLAGVCVDTVGTRPNAGDGKIKWYQTHPATAPFPDLVGETILHASLSLTNPGYRGIVMPFRSTDDTLVNDPQYGFPCPWITTHPFRGYHSSADTLDVLDPKGLALASASMAGYLYYLAQAETPEALELAAWQTEQILPDLAKAKRDGSIERTALLRHRHAASLKHLARWFWGGEKESLLRYFAVCERRVADGSLRKSLRAVPSGAPGADVARHVVRRKIPLAIQHETLWPKFGERFNTIGHPHHVIFWADGRRSIRDIWTLYNSTRRVPVKFPAEFGKLADYCRLMADIGWADLVDPARAATKERLVKDLRALGVKPGMDLIVHSALSKLGPVLGGAETVVDALLEAVGTDGTLFMPSFNHSLANVYNPLTTPTTNGAIPDVFWRRPGVIRSMHPSHAVAAYGPKAREWCAGHLENGIWAAESPIGRLVHNGGWVLLLGVDHNATTAYHIAEISLNCGCLDQFGSVDRVVTPDGSVKAVPGLAWRAGGCPVNPRKMNTTLDEKGLHVRGKVGLADAVLVKAIDVWNERREHLKDVCPTCKVKPDRRR
ncbi:MAG: AAC(3) family N-acetyltransferase [Planctomycetota bacterium]